MTTRAFNSIQGFSVGQNPTQDIILANGDITTVNFTANGVSNLGPIGNVKITGGIAGQVVTTDGTGNLSFAASQGSNSAAVMPYYIPSDKSYSVPTNFQGLFLQPIEIDGTLEIEGILLEVGTAINALSSQVLFDSGGEITGNLGFTFDTISGNLSVPGSATFTGNLLPTSNIIYDLGSPTKRWKDLYLSNNTIYIGDSQISGANGNLTLTNADGGALIVAGNTTVSTLENGNSNISINANANITVSINGTSNVAVFSSNAISITGNIVTTGIKTDNYYYANGQPIDTQNPSGSNTQIQYNLNNNFGASANFTFNSSTNVLEVIGNVSATVAKVGSILTDNYYYANGQPMDSQNPSGSNTQIQYNLDNNFGASANFAFNPDTNVLQVIGNINTTNANISNAVSANYLISSQGCVAIASTTIQVSGSDAGIFNINIGNLTVGLGASNLTFGSTSSNSTFRGNLVSNSYSTSGTVTTNNIKAKKITGNGNSVPVTTDTVIDSFAIADYRSAKYTIRAGCDIGYQAIEVLLVHDDINSIVTVYGSLSTAGVDLITLSTQIISGNVQLTATALTDNTNVNLLGIYVSD